MQNCISDVRLSTGPLRPEGDWTGVFIRTDEAIRYVQLLREVRKKLPHDEFSAALGEGVSQLQKLLMSGFGPK